MNIQLEKWLNSLNNKEDEKQRLLGLIDDLRGVTHNHICSFDFDFDVSELLTELINEDKIIEFEYYADGACDMFYLSTHCIIPAKVICRLIYQLPDKESQQQVKDFVCAIRDSKNKSSK